MKPPVEGFDGDFIHPNREYVVATNSGFRRWYIEDWNKPLRSMSYDYYWEGRGPHRSVYATSDPNQENDWAWKPQHPEIKNSVGFYGYYRTDSSVYPGYPTRSALMRIDGMIEGYGRCVIGNKGFRSEVAVILAFTLEGISPLYQGEILRGDLKVNPQNEEEIQKRRQMVYDYLDKTYPLVPIFDTKKDMLAMFPLSRKPVFTDDPRDKRM